MKAILFGVRFGKSENLDPACVYIPEAELISVADSRSVVYLANENRSDLKFFLEHPGLKICELDVPFDIAARIYCLAKDCKPSELAAADTTLWNELIKNRKSEKSQPQKRL